MLRFTRRRRRAVLLPTLALASLGLLVCVVVSWLGGGAQELVDGDAAGLPRASRRSLTAATPNSSGHAVEAMPPLPPPSLSLVAAVLGDSECHTEYDTRGAVTVHAALILYTFLGLAIVCDEYFCESLELISAALELSDDVAGATFMAAGSSAPELFTALITIFIAPGEQGVGTIVGSAVFNICVIIGLVAIGAGQVLQLWWYPLTRDSAVYAAAILLMVWAMADHQVSETEASVLVSVYVFYVVVMAFNNKIVQWLLHQRRQQQESANLELRVPPMIKILGVNPAKRPRFKTNTWRQDSSPTYERGFSGAAERSMHREHLLRTIRVNSIVARARAQFMKLHRRRQVAAQQQEEEEEEDGCVDRAVNAIALPLALAMKVSIPDCREERWRSWYFASFTMSIVWIGVLSFLMVDFAARAGCILEVDEFLMGLVVLSVGTSVPDALSSLIVARNGQGNMAVCNVLGSNVFNILVGLGLPWLVAAHMQGLPYVTGDTDVTEPALILFCYLGLLFVVLIAFGWRLTPMLGVVLLCLQALYWAWNICEEYGLISVRQVGLYAVASAAALKTSTGNALYAWATSLLQ